MLCGMPRPKRLDGPGTETHVIVNAVHDERLYRDSIDKEKFVELYAEKLAKTGLQPSSAALMTTHFHNGTRRGDASGELSRFMKELFRDYVDYYNRRHDRRGHLVRERFASVEIHTTSHSLNVLRYVVLNPLRAGMVRTLSALETYPWTSYPELLGVRPPRLIAVEATLRRFHEDDDEARSLIRSWVRQSADSNEWMKAMDAYLRRRPRLRLVVPSIDVDEEFAHLIAEVAARFEVSSEELVVKHAARNIPDAKAVAIHLAIRNLGLSHGRCAERFRVACGSVARLADRGAIIAREIGMIDHESFVIGGDGESREPAAGTESTRLAV